LWDRYDRTQAHRLTGMPRKGPKGSKIEIPLSEKSGPGRQAGSAGAVGIVHGVMWD